MAILKSGKLAAKHLFFFFIFLNSANAAQAIQQPGHIIQEAFSDSSQAKVKGAASLVKFNNTAETRTISVAVALQGRAAGVRITPAGGQAGAGLAFNIRGITSISGSNYPLFVVDGQPIEMPQRFIHAGSESRIMEPLALDINPNDIESVEVLKDAYAAALYGPRAANGVVLITTKTGKSENYKLAYTTRVDVHLQPKQINMLNSGEYLQALNEAQVNDGKSPMFSPAQINTLSETNTNWQDEIYSNSIAHNHHLAISKRKEKSNYYISGNFSNQNNTLRETGYKNGGIRVNYEKQFVPKLTVGARYNISWATRNYGALGTSVVLHALAFSPIIKPHQHENTGYLTDGDPLLLNSIINDKTKNRTRVAGLTAQYQLTKNITYNLLAGANKLTTLQTFSFPLTDNSSNSESRGNFGLSNRYVRNNIDFHKTINRHAVNLSGGFSYQKWIDETSNSISIFSTPGRIYSHSSNKVLKYLTGHFTYAYNKKYKLTLAGTYANASRLTTGEKNKLFPAVGAEWLISEEDFIKNNAGVLSNLLLRGSYGVTGNENIASSETAVRYRINSQVGQDIEPDYVPADFGNPNLKWETTKQINIGADFGFAQNRFSISVDYFFKNTRDILVQMAFPKASSPNNDFTRNNYYMNRGELTNRGIEVEAKANILKSAITVDAGLNFSVLNNKYTDNEPAGALFGNSYFSGGSAVLAQPVQVAANGFPIGSFWGYKTAGIYQNAAEVAAGPEAATAGPGDVKWVDTNSDGKITEADKTAIGNPHPDFTYGFQTNLAYKRFSAGISIFGSYGNEMLNLNEWLVGTNNVNGNNNITREAYEGRWHGEGTSNLYPKLTASSIRLNHRLPDWLIEDASFLRLQYLTVGYTVSLPQKFNGVLRIFVSGTNLITLTNYSGHDPHLNALDHNALSSGVDLSMFPQPKTFSGGLSFMFN